MSTAEKRAKVVDYLAHNDEPIEWLLTAIGLSNNAWYHQKTEPNDDSLRQAILRVLNDPTISFYGYRRVHRELNRRGVKCNHKRVFRLMRAGGPGQRKRQRVKPKTTNSKHNFLVYPNQIKKLRESEIHPGTIWVADITYISVADKFAYLALLMDRATRKIVGWSLERSLHRQLCLTALAKALKQYKPPQYHHSDRGVQYCSFEYIKTLKDNQITPSMADVGRSVDNPHAESLNGSIKTEEINRNEYNTMKEAVTAVSDYISNYNHKRLHSALGYLTPAEYEKTHRSG